MHPDTRRLVTEAALDTRLAEVADDNMPKYHDDSEVYPERGAYLTIARNVATPDPTRPLQYDQFNIISGKGDNSTYTGVVGAYFGAFDRTDVTALNKGVLFASTHVVAPRIDRSNVPFDDVGCILLENQGTAKGTDCLYIGHNRADKATNVGALDWGNCIQIDAFSDNAIRSIGTHTIGLSFSGATISTAAIRLGNAQKISWIKADGTTLQSVFRLKSDDVLEIYAGSLLVNAAGSVTMKNGQSIYGMNLAGTAGIEIARVSSSGSDSVLLYGGKVALLAAGGVSMAAVTTVPATPAAGTVVLYSDAGVLKAKTSTGAVTVLAT